MGSSPTDSEYDPSYAPITRRTAPTLPPAVQTLVSGSSKLPLRTRSCEAGVLRMVIIALAVAMLPPPSHTRASRRWFPSATARVSQAYVSGEPSALAASWPSTSSSLRTTPTSSQPFAWTLTTPARIRPRSGMISTCGGKRSRTVSCSTAECVSDEPVATSVTP